MQVRNSSIGKIVINSENNYLPSLGALSFSSYQNNGMKGGVGKRDVPEIILSKKVVQSPPQTEFKVQDYPLKRMNRGISGWDWQTECSEAEDLTDRAQSFKPKHSTFSKLFPNRNFGMYPLKKIEEFQCEKIENVGKEFNRKNDRISVFRESMLKAQLLFKMH